ncbi:hypothetical protein AUJ14_04050 [Candidatus Micrarchaeota archaeon CG1_02_55_22]|nr:MAG: hypothetical protein AUJ14_04050 [Candidatus Micrarchaeota archaeon CG1_02_55_22]
MDEFSQQVEDVFAGKRREKPDASKEGFDAKMAELRTEIDYCNKTTLELLKRRTDASRKVAICKWSAGVPNFAAGREEAILEKAREYGESIGVNGDDAREVIGDMLKSARREQDAYREKLESQ